MTRDTLNYSQSSRPRKRCRYALLACSLIVGLHLCNLALATDPEARPIHFTFGPTDGLSYAVTITSKRTRTMGAKNVTEDAIVTAHVNIHRTRHGWSIIMRPKDVLLKRDGAVIQDPLGHMLANTTVTYVLDREGRLLEVSGFENVEERILEEVPMAMSSQAGRMFDSTFFENRERAEWNNRIGDFVGMQTYIGETFEHEDTFDLHTGETLHRKSVTTMESLEPCGDRSCLRILATFGNTQSPESSTELRGSVSRLIDPDTMLIYDETSKRTIRMTTHVPGIGPTPIKMKETRSYTYQYKDPSASPR